MKERKYGGWQDRTDPRNAEVFPTSVHSTDYGRVVHIGFFKAPNSEGEPLILHSENGLEIVHICLGADEAEDLYQQLARWRNGFTQR